MSKLRLPYYELSSSALTGLRATKEALEQGPLKREILELVYLRVSQINGCAYCLQMHSHSLRNLGMVQNKLDELAGWRVSHRFSAGEQAALAWAEAVTRIEQSHAGDSDYQVLGEYFSEAEISDLTVAISLMNAFNRLAIGMRQ